MELCNNEIIRRKIKIIFFIDKDNKNYTRIIYEKEKIFKFVKKTGKTIKKIVCDII